jgi:hypothetical protein
MVAVVAAIVLIRATAIVLRVIVGVRRRRLARSA